MVDGTRVTVRALLTRGTGLRAYRFGLALPCLALMGIARVEGILVTESTSYDAIPYESSVLTATHPRRLAGAAWLQGHPAPPTARCRVLELGCGSAVNLVNQALTLPGSEFLGIDLSSSEIARGRALAQEVRASNVQLKVGDLATIPPSSLGQWDYVICHGVFSWVPPEARVGILELCAQCLKPDGVAYLSFNTYPGWHFRGILREMLLHSARDATNPREKIGLARECLEYLAKHLVTKDAAYREIINREYELLKKSGDYYLFHEMLEDENHPMYFSEFSRMLEGAGLHYLGDADVTQVPYLEGEALQSTANRSKNRCDWEQWTDYLRNRTFRMALVTRRPWTEPTPEATAKVIMRGALSALVERAELEPGDWPATARSYRTVTRRVMTIVSEELNQWIEASLARWPDPIRVSDLVADALGREGKVGDESRKNEMLLRLRSLIYRGVLEFVMEPFPDLPRCGDRPRGYSLARVLAARGKNSLPGLRHVMRGVDDLAIMLLPHLQGKLDGQGMVDLCLEAIRKGELVLAAPSRDVEESVPSDGNPSEPAPVDVDLDALVETIGVTVKRLWMHGMIVG